MASLVDGDPPRVASPGGSQDNEHSHEYAASHKSKFRFKSKRKSHRSERSQRSSDRTNHSREGHHRTRRRKRSPGYQPRDDPSLYDDTHIPNTSSDKFIDPDVAFRESLFDAMADDEGAQYWEGVYGQPIHTYPDVKEGPKGELERMTDDEYAAFVRAKMYEKTHQHLIEEKARRDAAKAERERLAKAGRKEEREAERFRMKVEESLKRGEERKKRKAWLEKWEVYTKAWEDLGNAGSTKVEAASIPWPVESGKRTDVGLREIERFFLNASSGGQPTEVALAKVLKLERLRWHPDKIQQKLGGQNVDEAVMQAVTAVFQVIDRMWSEVRDERA